MSPADIAGLAPAGQADQEMLYRVTPSATAADLTRATASIVAGLPADAIRGSQTYLEIKTNVDQLADLYVPVLLAFAVFALLAAAFLIANVVTGVVLTSYRDIGVMKAVGYTPRQVSAILGGQVLVPAAAGTVIGVALGTLASQPVARDTAASFGVPVTEVISIPVVVGVAAIGLLTTGLAAFVPALRAGRMQRGRGDDPRECPVDPAGRWSPATAGAAGPDRSAGTTRRVGRSRASRPGGDDPGCAGGRCRRGDVRARARLVAAAGDGRPAPAGREPHPRGGRGRIRRAGHGQPRRQRRARRSGSRRDRGPRSGDGGDRGPGLDRAFGRHRRGRGPCPGSRGAALRRLRRRHELARLRP